MTCIRCGSQAHPDRAEFLAEKSKTFTCMSCSSERPKVCLMSFNGKTAPSLGVAGSNPEAVRVANRAFWRAR